MTSLADFGVELSGGIERYWGAVIVAQHTGPPSNAIHSNIGNLLGDGILRGASCVYGGLDILRVNASPKGVAAAIRTIEENPCGGEPWYTTSDGMHSTSGLTRVVRVLPLGAPEEMTLGERPDGGRRIFLDISVKRLAGRPVDVLNAKTILMKSLAGKIVHLHATLGKNPGVFAELVGIDDLTDLDLIVTRLLPSKVAIDGSTTYIGIKLDSDDTSKSTWKSRLRAHFSEREHGENYAENTTSIARALGTHPSVIHDGLEALEREELIRSRKEKGIRWWWRREYPRL